MLVDKPRQNERVLGQRNYLRALRASADPLDFFVKYNVATLYPLSLELNGNVRKCFHILSLQNQPSRRLVAHERAIGMELQDAGGHVFRHFALYQPVNSLGFILAVGENQNLFRVHDIF